MKQSIIKVAMFAMIMALSIVAPLAILLTGDSTLMPLAQAGAIISVASGVILFVFAAIDTRKASKGNLTAIGHFDLRLERMIKSKPMVNLSCGRMAIQTWLLVAIGQPAFAALSMAGLALFVLYIGLIFQFKHNREKHISTARMARK